MKNKNFLKSVKCAAMGFLYTVFNEINFRIELSVTSLIAVFAYAYGLNREQWAILILTCAFVLAAELFNTADERSVDASVKEYNENAKRSKDAAAAGVTAPAAASLAVGVCLFGNIERILTALFNIYFSPRALICTALLFIFDIIFVLFCSEKTVKKWRKR